MGPITIFDKSFLQGLAVDEAVMFDHFYMSNVTPIFLMEVLGDLTKDSDGKHASSQRLVEILAGKTPCRHAYPNAFHAHLLRGELHGYPVEMTRRPVILGGQYVRSKEGLHLIHDTPPEVEAFSRWQDGKFSDAERIVSAQWRSSVSRLNLKQIADSARAAKVSLGDIRTLQDAKRAAANLIDTGNPWTVLRTVSQNVGFGDANLTRVRDRWAAAGRPPIRQFAPYACYVLEVDMVFELALSISQISSDRPSNRVDMFYLYYLPFGELFVSQDRLHQRLAPLFLTERQRFVWGDELKQDLRVIEALLAQRPEEERARGLMRMSGDPPAEHSGLTSDLWDHFRPNWRNKKPTPKLTPEKEKELLERLKAPDRGAKLPMGFSPAPREELTTVRFSRTIPRRVGRWTLVPDDIE